MVTLDTSNGISCVGTMITYTAIVTNGGTNPVYQWWLNGVITNNQGNTYGSTTLKDGDVITCAVTNISACQSYTSAPATAIAKVMARKTIGVNISSSANDAICPGTSVTFIATPVNVSTIPVYQWMVNGQNAGANMPLLQPVILKMAT